MLRPITCNGFEKYENVYITDHNLILLKNKVVDFIKLKGCLDNGFVWNYFDIFFFSKTLELDSRTALCVFCKLAQPQTF